MNWADYSSSILWLVLLLGVFYAAAWGLRRYSHQISSSRFGQVLVGSGKSRQLKALEALPLDTRRRLVRVQNGNREYVILIGGTTDLLVDMREVEPFTLSQDTANANEQEPA